MSTEVTLPALGESVTEGTVSRWLKEVGEHVEMDEPLLEVSTDKVDTEVPSPVSGTLLEIRVNEDEEAPVGAVLAIIGDASEAQQGAPTPQPAAPAPQPAPQPPAAPAPAPAASDATEVLLPALGESVTEGTVSRWLRAVGEQVAADEPLVEVSTDKVDTEIPSPASGVLLEIKVNEDEVAEVGQVLGLVGSPAAAPVPQPAPAAPIVEQAPEPAQPAPAPARAAQEPAAPAPSVAPRASGEEEGPYVTPLVRKMAADLAVDLNSITGTGVGGRVRKQDVQAAADAAKAAAEAAKAAAEAAKAAEQAPVATEKPLAAVAAPATPQKAAAPAPDQSGKRGTTEKMSRLRTIIAARMVESLQTAAQLTATVEVDLTAISKLRAKVKDDFRRREGTGLTYLAFISKAAVEALKAFPIVNASIDEKNIVFHGAEHLGIAVDTERGLIVPVIKDAGDLNVGGIAKQIADLAARGRDNKLGPDELSGATFTITNYGSAGALFDTPIINQPNSAILGTGALVKRPVVVSDEYGNDAIAIRDMMFISMSYDHRLVDGAVAARFLSAVKARLEGGDFGGEFGL